MHADDGLWIPDWQPGPARPALGAQVCHVWRVDLERVAARLAEGGMVVDGALDAGVSVLNADERERRSRFVFERHRRWFLAARTALRGVLGTYLGLDAAAVPIVALPHKRPTLAASAQARSGPLDFNLSHSDALALIAVTRQAPLGVDVELVRPMNDALALAERHFVGDEIARLAVAEGAVRDRAFFTCWTRKEAVLKSTGAGLSVAPSTFRVGATPEPLQLVFDDPAGAAELRVVSFEVRADALGACALAPGVRVAGMFDYVP
jgi:4'-phosphopantetheinyl transferase